MHESVTTHYKETIAIWTSACTKVLWYSQVSMKNKSKGPVTHIESSMLHITCRFRKHVVITDIMMNQYIWLDSWWHYARHLGTSPCANTFCQSVQYHKCGKEFIQLKKSKFYNTESVSKRVISSIVVSTCAFRYCTSLLSSVSVSAAPASHIHMPWARALFICCILLRT